MNLRKEAAYLFFVYIPGMTYLLAEKLLQKLRR